MSRFRRTYGQGTQLVTDVIGGGGGVTYDYAVDTYAELPSNPPDEIVVFVLNVAGPVSYGYYVYDTATSKWYLTYGMVNTFADVPATQVLYNTGITVELSLFSELAVFTDGRAVICTDVGIPTWVEQMPGVSVAEYTDLPLTPPLNYKIGCTNTSLAGLGPLQSVILQHDTGNNWFVIKAQINDVSEIPGSTTVFSDATYTVIVTGGTVLYDSLGRGWLYTGVIWQEFHPGIATDWGTFASQAAFPSLFLRDTDKAYSTADVATFAYDEGLTTWMYYRLNWDGTSPGQTFADLPISDIFTDAIAIVGTNCYQWSGVAWVKFGAAQISVGTFSELPASTDEDVSAYVTSLTGYSCIVTHSGGIWNITWVRLETSFEDRPIGTVYNSGGVVVQVSNGASMLWVGKDLSGFAYNATIVDWIPTIVASWTSPTLEISIVGTENSATLTANGWTVATAGSGSLTTDGTKVSMSANTAASSASLTRTFTSSKLYTHGRFQVSAFGATKFLFYHRTGAREIRLERSYSLVTAAYFVVYNGGSIPNNIQYSQQGLGTEAWVHYLTKGGTTGPMLWYVNGLLVTSIGVDFYNATGTGNFVISQTQENTNVGTLKIRDFKVIKGT